MKVLMVCLGNICRSPLAEGILQDKIKNKGLDWDVDSCGTSGFHNGEKPDSRSIEVARKKGVDINYKRSRQLTRNDLDSFDLILAMDSSNYNDILNLCSNEEQKKKVKLILNYAFPGENRAVPDPYYHGSFEEVYEMIDQACEALINEYY